MFLKQTKVLRGAFRAGPAMSGRGQGLGDTGFLRLFFKNEDLDFAQCDQVQPCRK
jgi:hypothetical protein